MVIEFHIIPGLLYHHSVQMVLTQKYLYQATLQDFAYGCATIDSLLRSRNTGLQYKYNWELFHSK
jgi:hypothetical protein